MQAIHNLSIAPVFAFQSAMVDAGLICPDLPVADGIIHRFTVEGDKNGSLNGWYVLYGDDLPAGAFGTWKTGLSETWSAKRKVSMTPAEHQVWQQRMKKASQEREKEQTKRHAEAQEKAKEEWQVATADPNNHPYLKSKQISHCGIRRRGERLVIPLRDSEGILHSLQYIDGEGNKQFLTGGRIKGCYCTIGPMKERLYLCEGYGTGATIHEATSETVAVAFNTGNLMSVSKALRGKYPDTEMVICADDDQWTNGNPGMTKAREAAEAINAKITYPEFQDTSTKPTDFNDLCQLEGIAMVATMGAG